MPTKRIVSAEGQREFRRLKDPRRTPREIARLKLLARFRNAQKMGLEAGQKLILGTTAPTAKRKKRRGRQERQLDLPGLPERRKRKPRNPALAELRRRGIYVPPHLVKIANNYRGLLRERKNLEATALMEIPAGIDYTRKRELEDDKKEAESELQIVDALLGKMS